jgi:hypothetical protein
MFYYLLAVYCLCLPFECLLLREWAILELKYLAILQFEDLLIHPIETELVYLDAIYSFFSFCQLINLHLVSNFQCFMENLKTFVFKRLIN